MVAARLIDAVKQFLDAAAAQVAPSTLALYKHYLTRFQAWAGNVRLKDITPAKVLQWSCSYHPVGIVQRLFRWAKCDARMIDVNPLEGMRKVRHGHRRRILSRLERVRLLRACRPAFRAFAVAMVESIGRPREMREVRWGDIRTSGSPAFTLGDLVAGRAYFFFAKFKAQSLRRNPHAVRIIPISPRLGRLLVRLWGDGRELGDVVFRNVRCRPWTVNAVRCQFRRLRVRAGLVVDVAGENVVAYSLRHTSATDAVGAGVKGFTLAELMGHSDVRMTQRYVHLRPDHLIEAMGTIAEWKQGRHAKNDRLRLRRPRPD